MKEFRYPLLALGACCFTSSRYSLNIHLFQGDALSAVILFVDPERSEVALAFGWAGVSTRVSTGRATRDASTLEIIWPADRENT